MRFSPPVYLAEGSPAQLQAALQQFPAEQSLLVLIAEGGNPNLKLINQTLFVSGFAYAGALFPKILYDNTVYESGLVIVPLPLESAPIIIDGLDNGLFNLQDLPEASVMQGQSLLLVFDGLARFATDFLRRLYSHFGTQVVYLGGGAGSQQMKQTPCILSPSGVAQNRAMVIPLPGQIKLGIQHGWERLMGPLIATEVEKNTIKQINWQPAFSVYRDVIEHESGKNFTKKNFCEIARSFPLGLEKEDSEDIVRAPIEVTDEGALVCVGEVPENALIHILKGEPETLAASASLAATMSTQQSDSPLKLSMIVDCISRFLFLGKQFDEELDQIDRVLKTHDSQHPAFGMLALGEISSIGDGFLEFLSKSVVIGTLD